jgi:uncharacterized protein YoxC
MRELKNIMYILLTLQIIQLVIVATQLQAIQNGIDEMKDHLQVIESTTEGMINLLNRTPQYDV